MTAVACRIFCLDFLGIVLPVISSNELIDNEVDGGDLMRAWFGGVGVGVEPNGGYGLKMEGIKPSVCHGLDEL